MVRILTDSSAGFTKEQIEKMGVEVAHITVNFDGEEYYDGLTISYDEFFKKLKESRTLPKTAMVPEHTYTEFFEDVKNKGDEMVALMISRGLAGTYDGACRAQKSVGYNRVYVIDTRTTISGIAALTLEAVRLRDEGKSGAEIAKMVQEAAFRIKTYAYFDTLKYLSAGGRVSAASATVGTLLNIKPVLRVDEEGKLVSYAKGMGAKKAQAMLISTLEKDRFDKSKPVYFGHASAPEDCEALVKQAKEKYNINHGGTFYIAAAVGTHTGPGAISVTFFTREKLKDGSY